MDYNFTAELEEELDKISRGEKQWKPLLHEFWEPFHTLLKQKEGEVSKSSLTTEATGESCPDCGKELVVKLGKFGKFFACSGYPECKFIRKLEKEKTETAEPVFSEEKCDKCGSQMLIREGRYGKYLACSGYPGLQEHPAPGEAQGYRRHLPGMQGRRTDREKVALRKDVLLLQPLSPVQVCPLGPAGREEVPQMRLSAPGEEGLQAGRGVPQMPEGRV